MPRQVFKKQRVPGLSDCFIECEFEELKKGDKFGLRDMDENGEVICGMRYYIATSNPYENSKGVLTIEADILPEHRIISKK